MFPRSSKGGGQALAFPDVCKVPAPPAPFAPIPYPNVQYRANLEEANKVDAQATAGNKKAQRKQKEAIDNYRKAAGDEAGTLKGIMSASQATRAGWVLHKAGGSVVKEGKATSMLMGMSNHNSSQNMPAGLQMAPSQTKVTTG